MRIFHVSLLFLLAMYFLSGCSVENGAKPSQKPKTKSSGGVINSFAEDITGYRAAKQGRAMQNKIREISAEHDKEMDAILDGQNP